jgi:urease subunit gamma/beta
VRLSPAERDRLLLFATAELARARRRRGLRLNAVEATALVADAVCEAARDGERLTDAIRAGRGVLTEEDLLPGVSRIVTDVRVEAVFEDGTRLAVVRDPFHTAGRSPDRSAPDQAEPDRAQPGRAQPDRTQPDRAEPGQPEPPAGRTEIDVTNTATVPVSVTSHFHFFEANPRLRFDRAAAYGMHLAIPAGSAVRFGPGSTRRVTLVPIGGHRVVIGFAGLVDGPLDAPGAKERALERARACGYAGGDGDGNGNGNGAGTDRAAGPP